jgi:hypothetical protein
MNRVVLSIGLFLGVVIILATFLPWATFPSGNFTMVLRGTGGDGIISLVAALLYIITLFLASKKMIWKIVGAFFSLFCAFIAFTAMTHLKMTEIGIGLWLVLIPGLLGVIIIFLIKKEVTQQPVQRTSP